MLYLIGLGLNPRGISEEGLNAAEKCGKIYLEAYTVEFPYPVAELEEAIGKKIIPLRREEVESLKIISEAKKTDTCLLVYGCPLLATTHISLVQEARKRKAGIKIIHAASIADAVSETGLQAYKFGKIASMPKWDAKKHFTPDSYMEIVKQNLSVGAHSLILTDIGLELGDAARQLEISAKNHGVKLGRIIVCQALGTKDQRIFYKGLDALKKTKAKRLYSFIIPSEKLHFMEKEALEEFS